MSVVCSEKLLWGRGGRGGRGGRRSVGLCAAWRVFVLPETGTSLVRQVGWRHCGDPYQKWIYTLTGSLLSTVLSRRDNEMLPKSWRPTEFKGERHEVGSWATMRKNQPIIIKKLSRSLGRNDIYPRFPRSLTPPWPPPPLLSLKYPRYLHRNLQGPPTSNTYNPATESTIQLLCQIERLINTTLIVSTPVTSFQWWRYTQERRFLQFLIMCRTAHSPLSRSRSL